MTTITMNETTTNDEASAASAAPATVPGEARPAMSTASPWRDVRAGDVASLAAVVAALGWAYAPNIASLGQTWWREPDYTHGFLVIPIALVILYFRWPTAAEGRPAPWLPGWLLVAASLAARALFHEHGQTWSESATLLPVIVGLGLARMGWPTFRRTWAAYAFLIFLLPLPPRVNAALSQPLQSLATQCACALLKLSGLWVMPEGNVILVGNERLEVAAACNGLSMLMSLAATVAATASLVPMASWKRAVLLASIIPIALGSNVLRIAATAWCYHQFGADAGSKYAHDAAGWLMMPTAMVLVGLEMAVMSWLILDTEELDRRDDFRAIERVAAPRLPEDRS